MAATVTTAETIRKVLNSGNLNELADALKKMKFGDMMEQVDETITIAAGTTINLLTQSAFKRRALVVQSVRVVTGTATGVRTVTDAGGTASTSVVTLSADGKTLTFEANITVARIVWVPAPDVDPDVDFATS
jgi:hypothetical protein